MGARFFSAGKGRAEVKAEAACEAASDGHDEAAH
jgi:hypothetical protein